MDQLPPEILSLIVSHLERGTIGPYASVSRQWQVAVENITFRQVRLDSVDIDQFQKLFSIPHRRAALAGLQYIAFLPTYSDDRCAKFERRRERDANNAAFTEAVVALFTILKSWEQEFGQSGHHAHGARAGRPINLFLCALSPTDVATPRPYNDMGVHRYERSILTLLDPDVVPEVERVISFTAYGTSDPHHPRSSLLRQPRTLRAASVARIASKLPNLITATWELEDCAFSEDTIRHKYRKDFADALLTMTTRDLQHFSLSFRFRDPSNDAFAIPTGTDPAAPGADDLSHALHHLLALAPKLHTCTLWGPAVLSPSLFASPPPDDSPSPRWPVLRSLTVQVGRTTPAGTWLYARDPSDADADASDRASGRSDGGWNSPFSTDGALTPAFDDGDGVDSDDSLWHETFHAYHALLASGQRPRRRFRTKVDGAAFEPFVAAASRAVLRGMPRLERLLLHAGEGMEDGETELRSGRQVAWECYGGEEAGERRIVVETKPSFRGAHPKWRPSEELRRLWEEYVGEEGKVEVYLCEDYY